MKESGNLKLLTEEFKVLKYKMMVTLFFTMVNIKLSGLLVLKEVNKLISNIKEQDLCVNNKNKINSVNKITNSDNKINSVNKINSANKITNSVASINKVILVVTTNLTNKVFKTVDFQLEVN